MCILKLKIHFYSCLESTGFETFVSFTFSLLVFVLVSLVVPNITYIIFYKETKITINMIISIYNVKVIHVVLFSLILNIKKVIIIV